MMLLPNCREFADDITHFGLYNQSKYNYSITVAGHTKVSLFKIITIN